MKNSRPRLILASPDIVKAIMGPVYEAIAEAFFSLNETIKKVPINERPARIEERLKDDGRYYYQTDHTAFESSATKDIQEHMEQVVYKHIFPELSDFFDVLNEDIVFSTGNGPESAMYYMPVSRWSGAPNTSLGNSITNYLFIQMVAKEFNADLRFIVEGDDGIISSDKELNIDQVSQYAKQNGFDLKMEEKESLDSAGFLSMTWNTATGEIDVINKWAYLLKTALLREESVQKPRELWKLIHARLVSAALNIPTDPAIHMLAKASGALAGFKGVTKNNWYEATWLEAEGITEWEVNNQGQIEYKTENILQKLYDEHTEPGPKLDLWKVNWMLKYDDRIPQTRNLQGYGDFWFGYWYGTYYNIAKKSEDHFWLTYSAVMKLHFDFIGLDQFDAMFDFKCIDRKINKTQCKAEKKLGNWESTKWKKMDSEARRGALQWEKDNPWWKFW